MTHDTSAYANERAVVRAISIAPCNKFRHPACSAMPPLSLEFCAYASDSSAVAQARQALAAALRGWVDHEAWAPELLPAVFAPGRPPASADAPHVSAQVDIASAHGICVHPASYRLP